MTAIPLEAWNPNTKHQQHLHGRNGTDFGAYVTPPWENVGLLGQNGEAEAFGRSSTISFNETKRWKSKIGA
jgi:hypothetical protein